MRQVPFASSVSVTSSAITFSQKSSALPSSAHLQTSPSLKRHRVSKGSNSTSLCLSPFEIMDSVWVLRIREVVPFCVVHICIKAYRMEFTFPSVFLLQFFVISVLICFLLNVSDYHLIWFFLVFRFVGFVYFLC